MMTVTIVAMEVLYAAVYLRLAPCSPHLILPAAAFASTPVDDATAPTPIRVSTGVTRTGPRQFRLP